MNIDAYRQNSIMEQLSIGVLVFNEKNELLYMNNSSQELLDISERKALGTTSKCLFNRLSFDIDKGLQHCRDINAKLIEHTTSFGSPMGLKKSLSISMIPLPDDGGKVLVEILDFHNFLQINNDENLISQNKLAMDMLRGLAHEIKNPLGGIRGAAQLLSKELQGQFTDYTRVIIDEVDRLKKLLDQMLGSSAVPNHQDINIHVILERVRQLVEAEVRGSIIIKPDYDPSIPDIKGDKDQLIQALLNIVRNATQAVSEGGEVVLRTRIHRNFTIGETMHRLAVKVDVIDNGVGISKEMQPKVFYPMVTGRTEGTGLGLSIAQTNVQRHGGIIEVSSELGYTVFSTIIPLET
ncbi:MAG: PAS domain-containing sensor histidine kinase [Cycloclasticus sp.]|nr:MAG: PAS domain-containing sensor histidine kinase [Cycloclasticus sp.]